MQPSRRKNPAATEESRRRRESRMTSSGGAGGFSKWSVAAKTTTGFPSLKMSRKRVPMQPGETSTCGWSTISDTSSISGKRSIRVPTTVNDKARYLHDHRGTAGQGTASSTERHQAVRREGAIKVGRWVNARFVRFSRGGVSLDPDTQQTRQQQPQRVIACPAEYGGRGGH